MSQSAPSSPSLSPRIHNKSGLSEMTIATVPDSLIERWSNVFRLLPKTQRVGLCGPTSPCLFIPAGDGRLTVSQRKVCYAYQLVARLKFGQAALQGMVASKTAQDLVISHLCGSRNCVARDHLILEPKSVNDERVHCHFCMERVFSSGVKDGIGW